MIHTNNQHIILIFLIFLLHLFIVTSSPVPSSPPTSVVPSSSASSSSSASTWKPVWPPRRVLVLGSSGLIGSSLKQWLNAHSYEVLEVRDRTHVDLRVYNALAQFENIDFVFFLACEVGGSKYIDSTTSNIQQAIIQHNLLIYQVVFTWLEQHSIPFIFTSSYLQAQPTSYGSIKRLGEAWIRALGFGKIVRLWNIYGRERPGTKSHVLTDWITSCLHTQHITSMTDGSEARQFLHANDCASAMGIIMENYQQCELVTDISSNEWLTLRSIARMVSSRAIGNYTCPASFSHVKAIARARLSPKTNTKLYELWQPAITLEQGIDDLFQFYLNYQGPINHIETQLHTHQNNIQSSSSSSSASSDTDSTPSSEASSSSPSSDPFPPSPPLSFFSTDTPSSDYHASPTLTSSPPAVHLEGSPTTLFDEANIQRKENAKHVEEL